MYLFIINDFWRGCSCWRTQCSLFCCYFEQTESLFMLQWVYGQNKLDFTIFIFSSSFYLVGWIKSVGRATKVGSLDMGNKEVCVMKVHYVKISNNKNILVKKIQDKICKTIQDKTAWENYSFLRKLDIFMFMHGMIEAYHFHWFSYLLQKQQHPM